MNKLIKQKRKKAVNTEYWRRSAECGCFHLDYEPSSKWSEKIRRLKEHLDERSFVQIAQQYPTWMQRYQYREHAYQHHGELLYPSDWYYIIGTIIWEYPKYFLSFVLHPRNYVRVPPMSLFPKPIALDSLYERRFVSLSRSKERV